jgi:ArsR family transcriptional regulator, arsenate/arsenite/antimonite-responsive transcriptional repressor
MMRALALFNLDDYLNRKFQVLVPHGQRTVSVKLQTEIMDHLQIQKISKALADETRLRMFEAISARKEMNCGEIVSLRGVTPATVSHHLKVLQDAGLIESRRHGLFVYSRSVPGVIEGYTRALRKIVAGASPPKKRSG